MKQFIQNLLTLPYRLYMLATDRYCWCDKCRSIVSGGFGYKTDRQRDGFICCSCADKEHYGKINERRLEAARKYDPTNRRSND